MNKTFLAAALLSVLVTGCADPEAEVDQAMNAAKAVIPPKIEPIPSFYEKRVALYEVANLRTPFISHEVYSRVKNYVPKRIVINEHRTKQPLEQFALESLLFSGVLSKGAKLDAMIQTPDGDMKVVRVGNYMGQNHGRVKEITKESMTVVEAIEDGSDGYVESIKILPVVLDSSSLNKP